MIARMLRHTFLAALVVLALGVAYEGWLRLDALVGAHDRDHR